MAVIARMLARRVLILIPLLLGVVLFVFVVMRFSQNKPEYAYFQGANPTPEQIHQFQVENGLLDPLPVRYLRFVGDMAQGDMGTSVLTKAPVVDSVRTALPLTLQLTCLGLLIAVVTALILGVTPAIFRDPWPCLL
jgi:peptide/nickel transport system permease protein